MGNALRHVRGESQKNIVRFIEGLSGKYSRWDIWQDFIIMSAIAIANTMGGPQAKAREEMYRSRAEKYSTKELEVFADMLLEVVAELERDPEQDFLGELFMALGLGNEWKGQFFTPYSVCRAMSAMTYAPDMTARIEKQGWISVNDPACGAGALLVAFANECRRQHINYQTSVLFVAQDIDFLAGCMCYIQLSLLGCPGYVVIDDSLLRPSTSYDARGLLPKDGPQVWYTPMCFRDVWHYRRIGAQMDILFRNAAAAASREPDMEARGKRLFDGKVGADFCSGHRKETQSYYKRRQGQSSASGFRRGIDGRRVCHSKSTPAGGERRKQLLRLQDEKLGRKSRLARPHKKGQPLQLSCGLH